MKNDTSIQPITCVNKMSDKKDCLFAGGSVEGLGIKIEWHDGSVEGNKPNGAFVETLIYAVIQRLQHFQLYNYSQENQSAINSLNGALSFLNTRTERRTKEQINELLNEINENL